MPLTLRHPPVDPYSFAIEAIDDEGLQSPSPIRLMSIIENARRATCLFWLVAVLPPTSEELKSFFREFVVRCVNRLPGIDDVLCD